MANEKCCCGHCALLWLSGFFAMPAVIHVVRLIAGWQITIAEHVVTTKESVIAAVVSGILAIILGLIGCAVAHKKEGAACC